MCVAKAYESMREYVLVPEAISDCRLSITDETQLDTIRDTDT